MDEKTTRAAVKGKRSRFDRIKELEKIGSFEDMVRFLVIPYDDEEFERVFCYLETSLKFKNYIRSLRDK